MCPNSNDKHPKRHSEKNYTERRRKGHVKREAKIRARQLYPRTLGATESWRRQESLL